MQAGGISISRQLRLLAHRLVRESATSSTNIIRRSICLPRLNISNLRRDLRHRLVNRITRMALRVLCTYLFMDDGAAVRWILVSIIRSSHLRPDNGGNLHGIRPSTVQHADSPDVLSFGEGEV